MDLQTPLRLETRFSQMHQQVPGPHRIVSDSDYRFARTMARHALFNGNQLTVVAMKGFEWP